MHCLPVRHVAFVKYSLTTSTYTDYLVEYFRFGLEL
jgi:hypothetical protein